MKHALKRTLAAIILLLCSVTLIAAGPIEDADAAYSNGNYVLALQLSRPLAEHGNVVAQTNLGLMYFYGQGVPQDDSEAMKWFRIAADQGNAVAQNHMGLEYDQGRGARQNYSEAVKWYRLAASQGDAFGQAKLGFKYARGNGVSKDFVLAHMWFNLAAAGGNKGAEETRDIIARGMTSTQIAEGQKLAREWKPTKQR